MNFGNLKQGGINSLIWGTGALLKSSGVEMGLEDKQNEDKRGINLFRETHTSIGWAKSSRFPFYRCFIIFFLYWNTLEQCFGGCIYKPGYIDQSMDDSDAQSLICRTK